MESEKPKRAIAVNRILIPVTLRVTSFATNLSLNRLEIIVETEIMVDNIIRDNSNRGNLKVLDMCTGSGCIGLALKKNLNADVTLADIDDRALKIARSNAEKNDVFGDEEYTPPSS